MKIFRQLLFDRGIVAFELRGIHSFGIKAVKHGIVDDLVQRGRLVAENKGVRLPFRQIPLNIFSRGIEQPHPGLRAQRIVITVDIDRGLFPRQRIAGPLQRQAALRHQLAGGKIGRHLDLDDIRRLAVMGLQQAVLDVILFPGSLLRIQDAAQ